MAKIRRIEDKKENKRQNDVAVGELPLVFFCGSAVHHAGRIHRSSFSRASITVCLICSFYRRYSSFRLDWYLSIERLVLAIFVYYLYIISHDHNLILSYFRFKIAMTLSVNIFRVQFCFKITNDGIDVIMQLIIYCKII